MSWDETPTHLFLPVVALIGIAVSWIFPRIPWIDLGAWSWLLKPLAHVVLFAVVAALPILLLRRWSWGLLAAWGIAVLIGAIDEWGQRSFPPRSSSLADLFFDALGATIAVLLLRTLRR